MAVSTQTAAVRAIETLVAELAEAGITASRDSGSFYPERVGVLVGLPTLVGRGMATRRFEIPVFVVSGDPLNAPAAVDALYALGDDCAFALVTDNYRPTTYALAGQPDRLPALELTVTVTVTETEE